MPEKTIIQNGVEVGEDWPAQVEAAQRDERYSIGGNSSSACGSARRGWTGGGRPALRRLQRHERPVPRPWV